MPKPIAAEVHPEQFEAALADCSQELRDMVAHLRTAAGFSGPGVQQRRYKHEPPNSGWGVTYYVGGEPFCDLHPKSNDGHVWGCIRGADSAAITAEGFEPSKQDGWFKIRSMNEAVRFANWIIWAHDQRSAG